ncbi:hypothetical protein Tco_0839038 [Tanacetum coccineum]|uniref:Uncharacterized protein n=1 Tax=Tanacetum coccineum TaxID=301880 RepID=A0ABQ5ATF4_9ASTR
MVKCTGDYVTPPDGAWTEYVSKGVTLLSISSTKHKERPLRVSDQRSTKPVRHNIYPFISAPWVVERYSPGKEIISPKNLLIHSAAPSTGPPSKRLTVQMSARLESGDGGEWDVGSVWCQHLKLMVQERVGSGMLFHLWCGGSGEGPFDIVSIALTGHRLTAIGVSRFELKR